MWWRKAIRHPYKARTKTFKPSGDTRLVFEWAKSERYGFELTADFGYGFGLVLMVWHYYIAVDWWRVGKEFL